MKDPKGAHPVSIILREQEYQELQKLARKTGRSTSGYFRQVLRWFLRSRGDCLEPQDYFQKKGSEEWESSGGPYRCRNSQFHTRMTTKNPAMALARLETTAQATARRRRSGRNRRR